MAKPRFLNVIAVLAPAAPSAAGGAGGTGDRLFFSMQQQAETQWCWAAVSASVSRFFHAASTWTQCSVANAAWSRKDCCGAGSGGPCNKPWYLDKALDIVGCFERMTSANTTFDDVKKEIAAGRPLCLRVGWSGNAGHFLAVFGWKRTESGDQFYEVDDPIYGRQVILRTKLETAYQGSGRWTHSYYVMASVAGGSDTMAAVRGDPQALGA